MGGGGQPEDNSDKVAQIEAQAAREAREAEAKRKAQELSDFNKRLSGAYGTGVQSARDFFVSQGLDPDQYAGAINSRAQNVRSSVPQLDASPGSYFSNLGQMVYDAEQAALRNKTVRGVNDIARSGYSSGRIADTSDDALINAMLQEQRDSATKYVDNLKARGVITDSGYSAALKNLEGQVAGATGRLNEAGGRILNEGRQGAENIGNTARTNASNLGLGDVFDLEGLGTQVGTYFTDFFNNLGTKPRAAAPSDLFDTSGLAGIAGAAGGAQNTPFAPNALAGIYDDEEEDAPSNTNPF